MLGVYDYTVILTYLSVVSACLGIFVTLSGTGHPYLGTFFLLFCGLCDSFDGRVARSKKNRSEYAKKFGIQIDSLSDLLAFGVLPICIGDVMLRVSPTWAEIPRLTRPTQIGDVVTGVFWIIMLCYTLAALIRLAHFNVSEEIRTATEGGTRKVYEGLPVTNAALIFPTVMLLQYLTKADITPVYFIAMFVTGLLFVSHVPVPKPGLKGILIMVGVGAVEFILLVVGWLVN